jgi:regulatory protein
MSKQDYLDDLRQQISDIEAQDVESDANLIKVELSDLDKRIRWAAMDLLARREHSVKELNIKLHKRFPDALCSIKKSIEFLAVEGLQSNSRFCDAYISMRKGKGYGPYRIAEELRERGVEEDVSYGKIYSSDNDWFDVAEKAWRKKFKGLKPLSPKEKSKQMRFMQYRGFMHDYFYRLM